MEVEKVDKQAIVTNEASHSTKSISKPRRAPAPHRIIEPKSKTTSNGGLAAKKKPAVRFDESALGKSRRTEHTYDPRKIKMGKAKPCRDLCILLSVFALLFFVTSYSGTKDSKSKGKKRNLTDLLQERVKEAMSRKRSDPCAIFLQSGSVPGTGWSLFAGQNYAEGDLLIESPQLLALDEFTMVPPYTLLIKHHPLLANAGGPLYRNSLHSNDATFRLYATRYIKSGEEIFVPYDAKIHEHAPFFDHVPSASDYQIAGEIIADMIFTSRSTKQKTVSRSIVSFVKRSIAKFNPRIAALLPENSKTVYNTIEPASLSVLHNQTLSSLQLSAKCANDLTTHTTHHLITSSERSWKTSHSVMKGDVVATVPIRVLPLATTTSVCAEQGECGVSAQHTCYTHDDSLPAMFCPLLVPFQSTGSVGNFNVEYRWHDKALHKLSFEELFDASKQAAWDVVATQDLAAGDELHMAIEYFQNRFKIPPSIWVSSDWKHSSNQRI